MIDPNLDPNIILKYFNQQISKNQLLADDPLKYQEFIDRCDIKVTQNDSCGIFICITNLWSLTIRVVICDETNNQSLELSIIPSISINCPIVYVWHPGSIFLVKCSNMLYSYHLNSNVIECIKKLLNLNISEDRHYLMLPDKIEIDG